MFREVLQVLLRDLMWRMGVGGSFKEKEDNDCIALEEGRDEE